MIPNTEIKSWKYYKNNIIFLYYPYDAMPEYNLEAGVEEQGKYVFIATDNSSMIFSNSDGSVRELLEA